MEEETWITRRMELIGVPLDKWQKCDLIEEVKRLRELEHARILYIMELQGIKGSVSTAEIDAALGQHSKKKTK